MALCQVSAARYMDGRGGWQGDDGDNKDNGKGRNDIVANTERETSTAAMTMAAVMTAVMADRIETDDGGSGAKEWLWKGRDDGEGASASVGGTAGTTAGTTTT